MSNAPNFIRNAFPPSEIDAYGTEIVNYLSETANYALEIAYYPFEIANYPSEIGNCTTEKVNVRMESLFSGSDVVNGWMDAIFSAMKVSTIKFDLNLRISS
ncbi:MAG: hypothetical protein HY960_01765 [Ignavibacteriae bacterium]|nr:hypothetical protein [Ignavibacteriota bacterium]